MDSWVLKLEFHTDQGTVKRSIPVATCGIHMAVTPRMILEALQAATRMSRAHSKNFEADEKLLLHCIDYLNDIELAEKLKARSNRTPTAVTSS